MEGCVDKHNLERNQIVTIIERMCVSHGVKVHEEWGREYGIWRMGMRLSENSNLFLVHPS